MIIDAALIFGAFRLGNRDELRTKIYFQPKSPFSVLT